ncbi:MAG: hypothetical protein ACW99F_00310 [Candidatus Hodarchaeales archaeon]|jgi:hypothetical protein
MEKAKLGSSQQDPLKIQILQDVNEMQKSFLVLMEDLYIQQDDYIKGAEKMLDDQSKVLVNFNPLSQEKAKNIRKRIFDLGGSCMRSIESKLNDL